MFKYLRPILMLFLALIFITSCSAYQIRKSQAEIKFKCAGLKEYYADLENGKVHYWMGGKGEPLFLIMGFGAESLFQWMDQVGPFAKRYTVITPDLLYFGGSVAKKEDYSLDFQVQTVVQLMDHLKIPKATVLGISYGGFVTFKIANDYPDRVTKLVVVDSPGSAFTMDDYQRMLKDFNAREIKEIIIPQKPEDVKKILAMAYYHPPWVPGFAYKDLYQNMFTDRAEEKTKMLNYMIGHGEEMLKQQYAIKQKTLLIWGKYDTLFPLEIAERLMKLLGEQGELKVIDKTRHAPNMENPKEFNKLVLDFLARN